MLIREDALVKISWGMLGTIGAGLIAIVLFLATMNSKVEAHGERLNDLEKMQHQIDTIQTDVAVMRQQIDDMHEAYQGEK